MTPVTVKKRTRDEIIAAFRESLRKKHEWEEQAVLELAEMRNNQLKVVF
mgnify:CR=1 FL=1